LVDDVAVGACIHWSASHVEIEAHCFHRHAHSPASGIRLYPAGCRGVRVRRAAPLPGRNPGRESRGDMPSPEQAATQPGLQYDAEAPALAAMIAAERHGY